MTTRHSLENGEIVSHRYPRTARVNHVVQEVLAEAIERASDDDDRLMLVTVTGVRTDPDLRHATVFYTARSEDASEALDEHRVRLQREIARQTRFKRTPQLSFEPDPAIASGWKVEEILKSIHERDDNRRDTETQATDETNS